jgi:hypothetical protein
MLADPVSMQQVLQELFSPVYRYAAALVAIGTFAMALIQTLKDLFPLRRWFQKNWIMVWLEKRAKDGPDLPAGGRPDAKKAEADLVRLATSNDAKAFYDLPVEQLCGQMNAALQVALDDPGAHQDLIWCFGYLSASADLNALVQPPVFLRKLRSEMHDDERKATDDFVCIRNRIAHDVQRSIDGVQIAAGFRWQWYLHIASIVLCGVISYIGLLRYFKENSRSQDVLMLVTMSVLAGFVAPVARDLIAGVQQWRK